MILENLVTQIKYNMPSLRFLSLIGNKACPTQLIDFEKDENDYKRYRLLQYYISNDKINNWLLIVLLNIYFYSRYFVLHYLPELRFLDSRPVTNEELDTALTKGEFTKIIRPVSVVEFCHHEKIEKFKFFFNFFNSYKIIVKLNLFSFDHSLYQLRTE